MQPSCLVSFKSVLTELPLLSVTDSRAFPHSVPAELFTLLITMGSLTPSKEGFLPCTSWAVCPDSYYEQPSYKSKYSIVYQPSCLHYWVLCTVYCLMILLKCTSCLHCSLLCMVGLTMRFLSVYQPSCLHFLDTLCSRAVCTCLILYTAELFDRFTQSTSRAACTVSCYVWLTCQWEAFKCISRAACTF